MVQDISLAVKVDKRQVKDLSKRIAEVEKQVGKLNKVKINLDTTKSVQNLEKLEASAKKLINALGKPGGIRAVKNSLIEISGASEKVSGQFRRATTAVERQSAALGVLALRFKALREEGRSLVLGGAGQTARGQGLGLTGQGLDAIGNPSTGAAGSTKQIIKDLSSLPRTLAASRQQFAEIDLLLENSVAGSESFNLLAKARNKFVERELSIRTQIKRASEPMPADPFGTKVPLLPAAGQTSGKFQVRTDQERAAINAALDKKLQIEKSITRENERQAKATRSAARERLNNIRKIRRKRQGKQLNDQLLGAGFPLLFGGGAGSIGGSLLGGALGAPFGATFGGQIFGSAIGQQLEQSVTKALELGEITKNINLDGLREAGILVNAEFQIAIEKLERLGRLSEAQNMVSEKVRQTTGLSGKSLEGLNEIFAKLGRVSMQFVQSFGALVGTLLVPLVIGLTGALEALLLPLKLINGFFELIALGVRNLYKDLGGTKSAAEILGGVNEKLEEARVKVEELGRAIREELIRSTEDLNLEKQITLGLTSTDRLTNIDVGLRQQETQIKRKYEPRFKELFKLGGGDGSGAFVLDQLAGLSQLQENDKTTARIIANRKREKETIEQTLRLTKSSLAVDKARLDLEKQTVQEFTKILSLSANETELLELKKAENKVLFDIDKKKLEIKLKEQLADVRNRDIRDDLIALNNIELTQLTSKFNLEQDLTKERERQLKVALANQDLANEDALAIQKFEGGVRLREQELAVNPAFTGLFGGSMTTEVLGNLRIEQELLKQNAAIRTAEGKAAESKKESDRKAAEQLKRQRDAYVQIEKAVLSATVFQEKYNEALALTTPVVDSLFDSLQAVAEGTKTAEQAFADFLRSIADMLFQAAKQMIAQYIAIGIARMFAGMGGGDYSVSGGGMPFGGSGAAPAGLNTSNMAGFFNPGAFTGKANGGLVSGNRPYLVGERGPELFVPGAQGNIVPNSAMGSANVTVNVDASGSSVEGDSAQASQLGKMLGAAVQAELIKQKRPGGLLA